MILRPEQPADVPAIRAVTSAAFVSAPHSAPPVDPSGEPGEATLVGWLREDEGFLPELSLVAEDGARIVGHGICTRGHVGEDPALGLGPISVLPDQQRRGVGGALVRALIDAARARGETVIALLGDPTYYRRFDFVPALDLGIEAPEEAWGPFFQALALVDEAPRGRFRYAAPFDRL